MAERIPFALPASLDSWEATDHAIGVLGIAGSVIRTFMTVASAPSGDDAVIDIRDAAAGGGDSIQVTITDGTTYATVTDTLAVGATETLYIRVSEGAGALHLSGWIEFDPTGTEEVSTFLTTLSRVKTDEGLSDATNDAQLSRIIQGVSARMQQWMKATIVDTTHTEEVHSGLGWSEALRLKHRPVTATETMVVKLDDSVISSSLYTSHDAAGIVYLKSGYWEVGRRNYKVTYSAGYTAVPEDLAMACTDQVRHEFHQTVPGKARLGLQSSVNPSGGSTAYLPESFLPSVIEAMTPYRRRR
jgi:hypothetical protein